VCCCCLRIRGDHTTLPSLSGDDVPGRTTVRPALTSERWQVVVVGRARASALRDRARRRRARTTSGDTGS
jgi:hypothetical protein